MGEQSPPQPQRPEVAKENLSRLEWKAPTLADLLQRLSVNPANAPSNR
jgi:hypothetical protein